MSLEDVYSKQVKGNTSISSLPHYGNPPIFERDPNLVRLEQEIFQQMNAVLPQEPAPERPAELRVGVVSFEDALRELSQMNK